MTLDRTNAKTLMSTRFQNFVSDRACLVKKKSEFSPKVYLNTKVKVQPHV